MRRRRKPRLGVAALVLTAAALPAWPQQAEGAREQETSIPSVDLPREIEARQEAGALEGTIQGARALQQRWNAERAELVAEQRRVEDELATLRELNADLEDDRQIRWMLVGGGLVLLGILLGVLIKSRPQRREPWR